jgi:polyhydroxybutyrate depolymerase
MSVRAWSLASVVWLPVLAVLWLGTDWVSSHGLPPQHSRLVVKTDQGDRECVIHVPAAYDDTKPIPLVIMLHGFGGTAGYAIRETGWSAKADRETFIIAYPEASRPDRSRPPNFRTNPQAWNDGSGRFQSAMDNIDDVGFIEELIDQLRNEYTLDAGRVYITGFSNGGSMAFRLAAELSFPVAAIAPVAGTCWVEKFKPRRTFSLCYLTGTADPLNPIQGGYPRLALGGKEQGGRAKPAVQSFLDQWIKFLDFPVVPRLDVTDNGVRKRVYGDGQEKAEILYITVDGLGHHWAGGVSQAPNLLVGMPTDKLKATDTLWDFFRSHEAVAK